MSVRDNGGFSTEEIYEGDGFPYSKVWENGMDSLEDF